MKSYILTYCIESNFNGKTNITDHFEVFCDYNELEETPLEQAEKRLQEIEQNYSESETHSLYTWNICEIVKTSEHYQTEEANPVEEAKKVLKANDYFVDKLWTVDDVKSIYDCTDKQAHDVLYLSFINEATTEQIRFSITEFAEIENLTKKL